MTLPRNTCPSWITCPEHLQKAGISWRVYQKGLDYDSKRPFNGNYGDNPLVYFKQYLHSAQTPNLTTKRLTPHPLSKLHDMNSQLPPTSTMEPGSDIKEHPASPTPLKGAVNC